MSCTRAIGTNSGLIDNFVSGEIGIVDTKGHIESGAFIAILGSKSCSANSIEQISVSPLSFFIEVINKGNRPNIVVRGIVYGSTLVCTMLITIGITKNALGVRIICVESGFDAIINQLVRSLAHNGDRIFSENRYFIQQNLTILINEGGAHIRIVLFIMVYAGNSNINGEIDAFLENCPEAAGPKSRLWQSPAGARKSTFILTPQRGGGVKVLLRYFLTRK